MTQPQTALFRKVYGCLAGSAIGDAMGGTTEMMHYQTIERLFGRVTDLLPRGTTPATARFTPGEPAGAYTDDTRLKHLLCQAIVDRNGRVTAADLMETWREHMTGWYFTPVLNSYYKVAAGDARPREAGRGNMGSNSTAMSISPIGIINAGDPRQAAQDAYDVAGLVHEGYARDAACSVAAAVAEAFTPGATVDSILDAATAYLDRQSTLIAFIDRALAMARDSDSYEAFRARFYDEALLPWPQKDFAGSLPPDGFYDTAEPRETVPTALGLFALAGGAYRDSVIYAANFGRDSDTIGAIIGAISGVFQGVEAIPPDWLRLVNEANPVNQENLARNMHAALLAEMQRLEQRLARLRQMDAV
ncbi:MAG: ADP-ribosylglycohydrolase family protein [Ardenticatenaceae bacterium]|nr:ADP-ribosylglycohydrolase family protein [Ardenticatenaceae bacterium]